ncbi:ABC transporter permease [Entomospira entomophila]|uniref:ABC transporter permease n=1 Tax=Entomospira entomophila TaxID=2719988 RepID=A0A968KWR3_9SPIO|nr:ABC transporter permease [Entomospira entomophilus]NIZ41070.1 ABC transporter permease [Entomospira entomophilus]WDI35279.1 ABC transporter permease [Entomospira entomophilus]
MTFIQTFLPLALTISAPIILASMGGLISEKSGIVNIGLEGLMGFGAFTAATTHVLLESSLGNEFSIAISLILAMIVATVLSIIHAFATITFKSNQIISGTGINLLASGLTVFFAQLIFKQEHTKPFQIGMKGYTMFHIYPSALIALMMILLTWYILNKRIFGLRLKACGESPQAASGAGIPVAKMQYIGVLLGGALAGLAGASMVLTQSIQYSGNFINGTGFIALAAINFGRWRVGGVTMASLLFGSAMTIAHMISSSSGSYIPREFFLALPYIITVLSLVFFDYLKMKRIGSI